MSPHKHLPDYNTTESFGVFKLFTVLPFIAVTFPLGIASAIMGENWGCMCSSQLTLYPLLGFKSLVVFYLQACITITKLVQLGN